MFFFVRPHPTFFQNEHHRNKRYAAKTIDQIIEMVNAKELRRKARVQAPRTNDEHVEISVPRLKMKTINKHISVLSSFYKWLVEAGKLPRSYCSPLTGLIKKEKNSKYQIQEERAVWTKDKVRKPPARQSGQDVCHADGAASQGPTSFVTGSSGLR